ncbi:MAG: MBL fold metallo-hydrolase [Anaerolineae bacterium]|nr:MBL fold metallo-hydrolase [Gemmatimonadaceae bacterium]
MKVWVLGSGSSGNAILLESGNSRVLIDAGFPHTVLASRLATIGVAVQSIDAVILTHEHLDHARGACTSAKKWGWSLLATRGTVRECAELSAIPVHTFDSNSSFAVGDFSIEAVHISHDAADPVAIVATASGSGVRSAIAYDVGCVTHALRRALARVDILVLEANHDEEMLQYGPYPPSVRQRISGSRGHLSNREAGELARDCAHRGLSHLALAHISKECNLPGVALATVRDHLAGSRVSGSKVRVCAQDAVTGPFQASGKTASEQLLLGV